MGFRNGAFATVWEVKQITTNVTKGRISISRKDKSTGLYNQEFSGYVSFIGNNTARNALYLKQKDRIKLGDVDVTTTFNKDTKKEYVNYKVFSFEMANRGENQQSSGGAYEGAPEYDGSADPGSGYRAAPALTNSDERTDLLDLETDDDELPF